MQDKEVCKEMCVSYPECKCRGKFKRKNKQEETDINKIEKSNDFGNENRNELGGTMQGDIL